jgi:hypothetical protein
MKDEPSLLNRMIMIIIIITFSGVFDVFVIQHVM